MSKAVFFSRSRNIAIFLLSLLNVHNINFENFIWRDPKLKNPTHKLLTPWIRSKYQRLFWQTFLLRWLNIPAKDVTSFMDESLGISMSLEKYKFSYWSIEIFVCFIAPCFCLHWIHSNEVKNIFGYLLAKPIVFFLLNWNPHMESKKISFQH